jgi:hypothetical protein
LLSLRDVHYGTLVRQDWKSEASRLKTKDGIFIKLVKVEDIAPIAVKPAVGARINELERGYADGTPAGCREIEFAARGKAPQAPSFTVGASRAIKKKVLSLP